MYQRGSNGGRTKMPLRDIEATVAPKGDTILSTPATPASVRKLGRLAGGRYARFAVEKIGQYGDVVPIEIIDSLSATIPDAIFSTAELMHTRGVEGHLIAAFIDGAFAGLRSKIARKI